MTKKEFSRLRRLVKEWRKANPTGSRQRFLRYLIAIEEAPPLMCDLIAAWRACDERRKIESPVTTDDAVAVILRHGIHADPGLDALRYLVECGAGNEALLLTVIGTN